MTIRSFFLLIATLFITVLPACGGNDANDPNEGEGEAEGEFSRDGSNPGEGEAEAEAEAEGEPMENWEVVCEGADPGSRPSNLPDPSRLWRVGTAQLDAAGQLASDTFDPRGCGFTLTCTRKGDDNQQCQDFSASCEAFRWRWEGEQLLIQTESEACKSRAAIVYEVTPVPHKDGDRIQLADLESTRRILVPTGEPLAECSSWMPGGKPLVGQCWDCARECDDDLECTDDRWFELECRCVNEPNDATCAKRGLGSEPYCGAPKRDCVCPHCHCYGGGPLGSCTEEGCLDSCIADLGCAFGDICHG